MNFDKGVEPAKTGDYSFNRLVRHNKPYDPAMKERLDDLNHLMAYNWYYKYILNKPTEPALHGWIVRNANSYWIKR